ncbi:MAG: helix-turn-helix transcriptional regulator [Treponema sp.]|nr:helix-turn-helix transcriptional regulator [Treponema sp.]
MEFEDFKKNFSDRLRKLRNDKKISAREMSLSLGQNVNYINYIENGRNFPSMQGFFLICDYLGISPAEFVEGASERSGGNDKNIEVFQSLTKKQQDSVIMMIKEFAHD